jgi:signal transduction histidine kinase
LPLELAKSNIDLKSDQIHHQMQAAIALADWSGGTLDVEFRKVEWKEIIDDAWQEAIDWLRANAMRSSRRDVSLDFNPAILKMETVGDRNLLRAVLSNLFKNAIKYSLPRKEHHPMQIRLLGQAQQNFDQIQIENFGIGIPAEMRERIFSKFVRIDRTDDVRPIRGMGLGLYIARLNASLHKGQVICKNSFPIWDDMERRKKLEGYLTTFELKIPRSNLTGIFNVPVRR